MPYTDEMVGALDPFTLAALRQRRGVMPEGGRQAGPATHVLENLVPHYVNALAGLPEAATHAAGDLQRTGDQYDAGPAMATALMTMGAMPFGAPRGAIGAGPIKPEKSFADYTATTEKALNSAEPPPLPSYADTEISTPKPKLTYAQHMANMKEFAKKQQQELTDKKQQQELTGKKQAADVTSMPWEATDLKKYVFPESLFQDIPREIPFQVPEKAQAAGFNVPAVHGTRSIEPFGEFKLPEELSNSPELGVHFGSPRAAHDFTSSFYSDQKPRTYPVVLKAQNPLEMSDLGSWGPSRVANALMKHREEQIAAGKTPDFSHVEIYRAEQDGIKALRRLIQEKGYDSIRYKNMSEDPGHISHIVLDPKQVRAPWAAFKDLNSRDLLSGIAGAGATGAATQDPQVQEFIHALRGH